MLYAGAETARLARRWLKVAEVSDGPLFRPVNKAERVADTRLTVRSVRNVVKRCAADAEIEGRISGHSLRVGATMAELMAAGRWTQVETVARYTREQDAASGPVGCLRYGALPPRRATMPAWLDEQEITRRESKRRRKEAKRAEKKARRAAKKARKELAQLRTAV